MENVCIISHFIDILMIFTDVKICIWIWISQIFFSSHKTEFDVVVFCFHIICIICSLTWPSLYCYFGSIATERIASIADIVYAANWYDYTPELRKHIILIVARSQEPVYFTGLGLIHCTVETFGKVSESFELARNIGFF